MYQSITAIPEFLKLNAIKAVLWYTTYNNNMVM